MVRYEVCMGVSLSTVFKAVCKLVSHSHILVKRGLGRVFDRRGEGGDARSATQALRRHLDHGHARTIGVVSHVGSSARVELAVNFFIRLDHMTFCWGTIAPR